MAGVDAEPVTVTLRGRFVECSRCHRDTSQLADEESMSIRVEKGPPEVIYVTPHRQGCGAVRRG